MIFIDNMQISPVNNIYNNHINFGINLQSKKLQFKEDDFYVHIRGYGHHSGWAKKIKETADKAVKFIRENCDLESILKNITQGVTEANQLPLDLNKRLHTGILRIQRNGWRYGSEWNDFSLITRYGDPSRKNKYAIYADRLNYTIKHPLKNPYRDIGLTRPKRDADKGNFMDHAHEKFINNAFERVNSIYDIFCKKYILNEAKEEDLSDINSLIAEIRWILAHSTPWERGSDAISNTFIRSIYKAAGIKAYPLKRGVSLDLEAYCTNLDEYKNNFANYFIKKPEIVE